jgi:alpha-D-xyloside xylohydrolase
MNSVIPDDLYVRWTQFGVFTSHIRYHGTSKREPYYYPNIATIVRKWWKLRYALVPYILEQSKKTTSTGFPVLRALLLHHPKDKMCWHIDDQYYFGDDFIVAPIMNSENKRDLYLPEGDWVNFFTGDKIVGGKWLYNFEVVIEEMPVWVKNGAILPIYPEDVNCTDDMDLQKTITITIDANFKGIWNQLDYLQNIK